MSIEEYKSYCIYRGEHFLTWLRDGDYECHILADMGAVSKNTFKDIVALLMDQQLVELYDNETKIRLTNPGRLYLLNKATDIVHAGDGMLFKQAYPGRKENRAPPRHARYSNPILLEAWRKQANSNIKCITR